MTLFFLLIYMIILIKHWNVSLQTMVFLWIINRLFRKLPAEGVEESRYEGGGGGEEWVYIEFSWGEARY